MKITYLGHAGFVVESSDVLLLMDPWLSPNGAFCKSWYQYPNNHFLFDSVNEFFSKSEKDKYIYISHEHKDHFDSDFLRSLLNKDFNFIIPNYKSHVFRDEIYKIPCKKVIECEESDNLKLNDLSIQLFIDDTGINRDSGIIVSNATTTFLNMNDCKLYDSASEINLKYPVIDIVAVQFSGATWYPICYNLDVEVKNEAMANKRDNKFALVSEFISKIDPRYYVPSAGPPCFLSDELQYINFINPTQFPQKEEFIAFFEELKNKAQALSMNPGDVYSTLENKLIKKNFDESELKNRSEYISQYSKKHHENFHDKDIDIKNTLNGIIIEKLKKIKVFSTVQLEEPFNLYLAINNYSEKIVEIDFNTKKIKLVSQDLFNLKQEYYKITAPAWLYEKVFNKEISWTDFALTFRVKIDRKPNVYSSFIQGFLLSEVEDCKYLLEMIEDLNSQEERVVLSDCDNRYEIDRYCPHMGADLKDASIIDSKYVVCPRHGWKFDLSKKGQCPESNNATINSKKIV